MTSKGDVEKLKSGDPEQSQRKEIEAEGEASEAHIEPPPKRGPGDATA